MDINNISVDIRRHLHLPQQQTTYEIAMPDKKCHPLSQSTTPQQSSLMRAIEFNLNQAFVVWTKVTIVEVCLKQPFSWNKFHNWGVQLYCKILWAYTDTQVQMTINFQNIIFSVVTNIPFLLFPKPKDAVCEILPPSFHSCLLTRNMWFLGLSNDGWLCICNNAH